MRTPRSPARSTCRPGTGSPPDTGRKSARACRVDARTRGWVHNAYEVDLKSGNGKMIAGGTQFTIEWLVDDAGNLLVRSDFEPEERRVRDLLQGRGFLASPVQGDRLRRAQSPQLHEGQVGRGGDRPGVRRRSQQGVVDSPRRHADEGFVRRSGARCRWRCTRTRSTAPCSASRSAGPSNLRAGSIRRPKGASRVCTRVSAPAGSRRSAVPPMASA